MSNECGNKQCANKAINKLIDYLVENHTGLVMHSPAIVPLIHEIDNALLEDIEDKRALIREFKTVFNHWTQRAEVAHQGLVGCSVN